jgi:glycyl-tRNA synthetase beta subunit
MNALTWARKGLAPQVPLPWRCEAPPEIDTARWIDPIEEVQATVRPVPLWTLKRESRTYRFVRPILVRVWKDGGFVFAESRLLQVTGTGTTIQEAMNDLALHITHFHSYYRGLSEDQVIGEAAKLKGIFREHVFEE